MQAYVVGTYLLIRSALPLPTYSSILEFLFGEIPVHKG